MAKPKSNPDDLVMTQAELPPGIDLPSPPGWTPTDTNLSPLWNFAFAISRSVSGDWRGFANWLPS